MWSEFGLVLLAAVVIAVFALDLYEFVWAVYHYRLLQVLVSAVVVALLVWWAWDRWG